MKNLLFIIISLSSMFSQICHEPTGWCYDVSTEQAFYFFETVVVDGEIVVRPMMYLALSYDHRLIDGREAVQFLVAIKT